MGVKCVAEPTVVKVCGASRVNASCVMISAITRVVSMGGNTGKVVKVNP